MKKIINKFIIFDEKYKLTINASSITFYVILSVGSLSLLLLAFLIIFDKLFASFIINDILQIIGNTFNKLLNESINHTKINGFSFVLLISTIYSSSSCINRLTLYTNDIYTNYKEENYIKTRLSAVLLFSMLILVIIGELMFIFYSKYFFYNILKIEIPFLENICLIFGEILMLFVLIVILYMYLPPKKIKFNEVSKISLIISIILYLILLLFKTLFYVIVRNNIMSGISFVLISISYLIFIIVYIILLGIIYFFKKHNN